ncbi:MAG: photosynthetic complex putative assembly protein PuhB [Polymorphobacter sp.]|uniref:photosynthetic complex putative assembly protein PuhB n=1 Tax=Polymorphobacter sp. TaxID=1909290 RepID=UPI003A83F5F1
MTMEYEIEPIRGLPGNLPKGEHIVWQGTPDWRAFARSVFHTRLVMAWFLFVASLAFVGGGTGLSGAVITLLVAVLGLAVLGALAWAGARATIYTLTNRRLVMRFGAAVPKAVNLPLSKIGSADVRPVGGGFVDIVLAPTERFPLGWLQTWPHVRPWKVAEPQPMLRAVSETFVPILADALKSADPAVSGGVARQEAQAPISGLEAAA